MDAGRTPLNRLTDWLLGSRVRMPLDVSEALRGGLFATIPIFLGGVFNTIAVAGIAGGVANPVYALLLAHTNDYLEADDMAAASAGLLFLNGLGAIGGPLIVGRMMTMIGPNGWTSFPPVSRSLSRSAPAMPAAVAMQASYRPTRQTG